MARLNPISTSTEARSLQRGTSHAADTASDSTPSFTEGSDKENLSAGKAVQSRKRKSDNMEMSRQGESSASASKRRRAPEDVASNRSRQALQEELNSRVDRKYYDPDQDVEQIRSSRRQYRDLISRVNDSRAEYLESNSKGIEKTLDEADSLFGGVKQTSVATIDSRLLVSVGDLANRKVNTLALGDSSVGVDVEDFITKCISFMKGGADEIRADVSMTQSTQRRRRRRVDEEDDDDEDDPMNWSCLGKNACFLTNSRPSVSGFLLGPLSVQKKVRQATQRKAKQTQADSSQAARPTELAEEDLEKQESANLTVVCGDISRLLTRSIAIGEQRITEEYSKMDEEDTTNENLHALMIKHGLADNGCIPLFNFCVNPRSFGQTVENMFYISFLIKEGKVGLDFDGEGLPTLGTAEPRSVKERQETQRNQAVFTLDFDMWQELVDSFGIKQSIIPHRVDEDWDDGTLRKSPTLADELDE